MAAIMRITRPLATSHWANGFPLDAPSGAREARAVSFLKSIRFAIVSCGILCTLTQAQIPLLGKPAENATAPEEKPEDSRKRLEQWQKEARDALARLDAGGSKPPEGISAREFENHRRDLEQMVLVTSTALKNFEAGTQARRALEQARTDETAWAGFEQEPPYSILLLDELQSQRSAVIARRRTHESALSNMESLRSSTITDLKKAEDAVKTTMLGMQNADSGQMDAAKWRHDAARAKSRSLAARAGYLKAAADALGERITAANIELSLVERKIATVKPRAVFSEEDLAKVESGTRDRISAYEKETAAVSKRLQSAMAERAKAQSALDAAIAETENPPLPGDLAQRRFQLEAAEARVGSLQTIIESLEGLVVMEDMACKAYQDRRILHMTEDQTEHAAALESIMAVAERHRAWLNVLANEMATCAADLSKIESATSAIPAADPRFAFLNEQRAALSEKLAMLQRVHQTSTSHRALLRRWIAEHSPDEEEATFGQRWSHFAATARDSLGKIWSHEVMSYEDKIEVDGETITGRIPVTLGMLLRALLFFVIGYAIAAHLGNRLQRIMVTRGHIAEAQARTLRNWAMIMVGVSLALVTLSFLKIPLTVFAFFGGALAIGLGFGMQTLIKNFISGIIVLAERKVRVGDMLDVDGIIGRVIEVNTRSSIIRSADDVETMIPNSLFLENRVTNWTLSNSRMRRNVRVGVAYGTDTRMMMDILTDCAGRHGLVCKDPAPFAVFDDFGDNALVFTLYFWVELIKGTNAMIVASDLRLMIEKRLTEAGISVPFPQRDIHLITRQPINVRMTDE
jgi:potassium-dependent mechanosensitive channel